jgi:triosephosphate isomerase
MRQTIIAGNWKMNSSKEEVNSLTLGILSGLSEVSVQAVLCVPFPYLSQMEALSVHSSLKIGAQNLNVNASGAYTGEVSADMIKDFSAQYVIVGHSERRSLYGESNDIVADKVKTALDNDLIPLFCVGESLSERESEQTETVISKQIQVVIDKVGVEAFSRIIVAYEPIWAIGTGVTATPDQAQQTHQFIRNLLAQHSTEIGQKVHILYGGSMNPSNASELLACADIDGGLIGGASLKAQDFLNICKAG